MAEGLSLVATVEELRAIVREWRRAGLTIGMVPTMGALHQGHGALVAAAQEENQRVIVTVFVNPTQFGAGEDLEAYPRDLTRDRRFLGGFPGLRGIVFAPSAEEMYPQDFSTTVRVSSVTQHLCGSDRPGHFEGVATVVTKLLLQGLPDRVYFGEKDFQQLQVVRRLVEDLDLQVSVRPVPIVRESDGLAVSSRNVYLSDSERGVASALYEAVTTIADAASRWILTGGEDVARVIAEERQRLLDRGFDSVDYLELRDGATLEPVINPDSQRSYRVFAAARLGTTRLIDNVAVVLGT